MGLRGACVEGTAGKPGRGECCWRACSPCSHAFRMFLWPYAGGMEARSAIMPTGEKLVSNGTALSRSKGNGEARFCSTRGRGTLTPKASLTKLGEAVIAPLSRVCVGRRLTAREGVHETTVGRNVQCAGAKFSTPCHTFPSFN